MVKCSISVGIDIAETVRYIRLAELPDRILSRIWTAEEIRYCRSEASKTVERLAVRFAAREALYKACNPYCYKKAPFFIFCRMVGIDTQRESAPRVMLNMRSLSAYYAFPEAIAFSLSVSHTATTVVAVVIASVA